MRQSHRIGAVFIFLVIVTALIPTVPTAVALSDGDWEYTVTEGEAAITKYNGNDVFLTIPSTLGGVTVTTITEYALSNNLRIKTAAIPDSVTAIQPFAFAWCEALTDVSLGSGVISIDPYAFYACDSLTGFSVSAASETYADADGVLFSKDLKTLIRYPMGITVSSYTLPNGTAVIGDYAFFACNNIESIILPAGLTAIGTHAFQNSKNLKRITLPDGLTAIGDYAFYACEALNEVSFPNGVSVIGSAAFYNCLSLRRITLPNSLTVIGDGAFFDCWNLESITIPDKVTVLGEAAFAYCSDLKEITIGSGVTVIPAGIFEGCISLTVVSIPENVIAIREYAFAWCDALTGITIPKSVTTIDRNAFHNADANVKDFPLQNLTIFCYTNSAAHTYARENGLSYKLLDAPSAYKISFAAGTGSGSWNTLTKKEGSTVTITAKCAAAFSRKGYAFAYFLGSDGKKYKSGAKITVKGDLILTAKYSKVSVPTKAVTSLKLTTPAAKQLKVTYKAVSGANGYRIEYSTGKSFTKATTKTVHTTKLTYTFKSLTAKKTYYVRVTAYKTDSTNAKLYSKKTATKCLKTK